MSGVVAANDNDDAAVLLDVEDDDDLVMDLDNLEPGRSGGFGRGRKGRKRMMRAGFRDPYTVVRRGTFGQLLGSLALCCVFFGLVRKLPQAKGDGGKMALHTWPLLIECMCSVPYFRA